ncbi:MAG: metallophosphoesterase [Spirochaetaceae bacterium]|jgi:putative phosphoesterase|nr:metallophosphoesterase [Spirochaetaceae bacterium]
MNDLCQIDSLLIGSREAAEELEQKESARLLVVSDSHGKTDVLEGIIKKFGPDCDALIFSGDGCWDIASCLEKAYTNTALKEALPPVLALARGNGDEEQYRVITDDGTGFPMYVTDRQILKAAGRKIFITHGHRQRVEYGTNALLASSEVLDCDLVFFGHTHRPYMYEEKNSLLLNPGSCARPRGGVPPTIAIVEYPSVEELYSVEFYQIEESFGRYKFSRFYN